MFSKKGSIILVISVLALATLACSALSGGTSKIQATAEAAVSTVESGVGSTLEAPTQGGDQPTDGSETGGFSNLNEGLSQLDSYRARFTMTYTGTTTDGQPDNGSLDFMQEVINASGDNHFVVTNNDSSTSDQNGTFEMYKIGDMSYMVSMGGDNPGCMGFSSTDQADSPTTLFNPDDMFGSVENAKLVKRGETMNGVKTDHYKFDQSSLTLGALSSGSGEAWIAVDGNYVVKFIGTATGKYTFKTEGEGTITWEYNLEDINNISEIVAPAECEGQQPATDIPVPENATEVSSFAGMITFKSTDDPSTLADYYRSEMPNQGWTAGEETPLGDMFMLNYTKDNRTVDITIMKGDNDTGSTVMVSETKPQ